MHRRETRHERAIDGKHMARVLAAGLVLSLATGASALDAAHAAVPTQVPHVTGNACAGWQKVTAWKATYALSWTASASSGSEKASLNHNANYQFKFARLTTGIYSWTQVTGSGQVDESDAQTTSTGTTTNSLKGSGLPSNKTTTSLIITPVGATCTYQLAVDVQLPDVVQTYSTGANQTPTHAPFDIGILRLHSAKLPTRVGKVSGSVKLAAAPEHFKYDDSRFLFTGTPAAHFIEDTGGKKALGTVQAHWSFSPTQ